VREQLPPVRVGDLREVLLGPLVDRCLDRHVPPPRPPTLGRFPHHAYRLGGIAKVIGPGQVSSPAMPGRFYDDLDDKDLR